MGEKNMFKKSSKFFDREGFYIILFVCLCIVAVTAVYISRNNANTSKKLSDNTKQIQQTPQRNTDPLLTKDQNGTVATSKQPVKTTKDVAMEMSKAKKSSTAKASTKISHASFIKLSYPVKGEVTKKFDNQELQESKTLGQWETHEGIDIACDLGTEVKAAHGGKIIEVVTKDERIAEGEKTGFGTTVVIDHENGFRTVYSNLATENLKVKKGDTVKDGQIIGAVGDTSVREASSIEGSHLHFAVLKKSGKDYVTVNPQEYLK